MGIVTNYNEKLFEEWHQIVCYFTKSNEGPIKQILLPKFAVPRCNIRNKIKHFVLRKLRIHN